MPVVRLDPDLPLPAYAHPGDAGADLVTTVDVTLQPGERALVPTGIAMAVPEGYVALVHPRSGLAARHGLSIVNTPGTIDAGYRGEIKVLLINHDPAAADRAAPRRPGGPAGVPAGRAGGVRRGGGPPRKRARGRRLRFYWRLRDRRPGPRPRERTHVRFRRKAQSDAVEDDGTSTTSSRRRRPRRGPAGGRPLRRRRPAAGGEVERVDLGSLLIAPEPDRELRLQVDEASGVVQSVVIAGPGRCARAAGLRGAAQRRPLVRGPAADRRGGRPGGRHGHRARGPVGHRAGLPGRPALRRRPRSPAWSASTARAGCCAARCSAARRPGPTTPKDWEESIRKVAVRRGAHAMPVGEGLPGRDAAAGAPGDSEQ